MNKAILNKAIPKQAAFKIAICTGLVFSSLVCAAPLRGDDGKASTALRDYVAVPDASYKWAPRREGEFAGGTYVELTLTSQTWHDIVWKHQLFVFKPAEVGDPSQAILLIAGGRWSDDLEKPAAADAKLPGDALMLASLANHLKAPVAVLLQVPQQPIFGGMVEDQIISYTFEQYFKTQDPTWPLLLPMVKSAVRGMDAVQAFSREKWNLEIKHFTLTGASKRGWTTWLTGAIDPRANAIAPMVIDMLNMESQTRHQVETFGKYSEQLDDYTNRGIQEYTNTPVGKSLRSIVDPFSYRDDLKQPKLILLGTNDRYWPLDALNLYWSELPGEKHVLYVPNNGHGLRDLERVAGTIAALHREAAGNGKMAQLSWDVREQGGALTLEVKSDQPPEKVAVWVATSATRDFRDAHWSSTALEQADGAYRFRQALPAEGNIALFGEARYAADGMPYFLSTNVKISEPRAAAAAGK